LSTVDYHCEDLVEIAIAKLFSRLARSSIRNNRTLLYGTVLERESSR
jgi:DNA-binding LacI/PurR family transcriptional regulator